jgi:photosystem II stability/assembly factor-like uncharacterized protein
MDSAIFSALECRCIGPHRGGRATTVVGHPTEQMVFYFGACNGGVWKTIDGGTYWENISDGFFSTAAVGALAISESDPDVLYAGTGEACIRNDVSSGDGVYKSVDGGTTWTHVGLADTRHIGRIVVHPTDPNTVYVAALGHAWAPNEERGVFRSADGGTTWECVLHVSDRAGAVDLALDPTDAHVLYASIWEVFRNPWTIASGGEDSGLYKTTDSGDSWTELTRNPGLPAGLWGRSGVALTTAQSGRVYAMIEAEDGGLYRSDDAGETWLQVNSVDGRHRPWYHTHLTADPLDADTVWVMDVRMAKSTDGGRTFGPVATPHADYHGLWIDPRDTQRMINANDGGATVSFNGGRSWSTQLNQPTAPMYHVAVDNREPYRVYGTQQDNTAISVPSQTVGDCIRLADCYPIGFSESGHVAVRPDNPDIVYSGAVGSIVPAGIGELHRANHAIGDFAELRTVWPEDFYGWAPKDQPHRFQWTYPIVISPHDPTVLYVAANTVLRSTDEGRSWVPISPDLTRDDPSKQITPGGPITAQGITGADTYCTIFALAESPHEAGVLWAGSDDGLLHLSTDGGQDWKEITPQQLPEWATIATVELSPHDPGSAYVAAYRYKLDDYRPYLFRTTDHGQSWQAITNGIADADFVRVVRADPVRPGLLYAGTETGLYVSFDDGAGWLRVSQTGGPGDLPVVPIYDLAVKDDDLVIATHGRSFWILDNLSVLRRHTGETAGARIHLSAPAPTKQWTHADSFAFPTQPGWINYSINWAAGFGAAFRDLPGRDGTIRRHFLDAGTNPSRGVLVSYHLPAAVDDELSLVFLTDKGDELCRYTSEDVGGAPGLRRGQGWHRFVWDMRAAGPDPIREATPGSSPVGGPRGPRVPPGDYMVRLAAGEHDTTAPLRILSDPRSEATPQDEIEKYRLLCRVRDTLSATNEAINEIREVRAGLAAPDQDGLVARLSAIEDELVQTKIRTMAESTKFPFRLNAKLHSLAHAVEQGPGLPTQQAYEVFEELSTRVRDQLNRLRLALDTDTTR